jgi:hypothetical protein
VKEPTINIATAAPFECLAKGGSKVMLDSFKPSEAVAYHAEQKSYRCYFTNANDRIQSYEVIDCQDDAEAALKAQELLGRSDFMTVELWQGRRLIGKWANFKVSSPSE